MATWFDTARDILAPDTERQEERENLRALRDAMNEAVRYTSRLAVQDEAKWERLINDVHLAWDSAHEAVRRADDKYRRPRQQNSAPRDPCQQWQGSAALVAAWMAATERGKG
jgi:hypothetical protein